MAHNKGKSRVDGRDHGPLTDSKSRRLRADKGDIKILKNMVKTVEYRDPNRLDLIKELKGIGRKEESRLWVTVALELSRARRSRREVNLHKINKHTTQGDVVVVPGKVLGGGRLEHKVDVAAYRFTEGALQKIRDSGGQAMNITELAKKNPKGSKVKLVG